MNVAYRWFLGYTMAEKIPHFATILRSVNPVRPADPEEERCAIQEVQLGVVGILTAKYSHRLISSKDSPYDDNCAAVIGDLRRRLCAALPAGHH